MLSIHLKVITFLGSPIPGGISGLLLPVVLETQGYIGSNQSVNIFVTFSRQPTLTFMILETISTKLTFPQNVVCFFGAVNITGDIQEFRSDFDNFGFI